MSDEQPPQNPLFAASNLPSFQTNSLFMPVQQEQSPAVLNDAAEEQMFVVGNEQTDQSATITTSDQMPTFSDFSNSGADDPFSSIGSQPPPQPPKPSAAPSEEQPALFVPSSTPTPPPTTTQQPPQVNPFAHQRPRGGPRPMFVPNPLISQSPQQFNQPPPMMNPTAPPPVSQLPPASVPPQVTPPTQSKPPSSVIPPSFDKMASQRAPFSPLQPVTPHWFYCKVLSDNNQVWCPFSYIDSKSLESAFQLKNENIVRTEGGRYDVDVSTMQRMSVYWQEANSKVTRCTWFHKSEQSNIYQPYDEEFSNILEEKYVQAANENVWHKTISLQNGHTIVLHGPQLVYHFVPAENTQDDFGSQTQMRSKIAKRGISNTDFASQVPKDECGVPSHIVFFCHGVGPVCDLRKRSIVECVDEFRGIHQTLLRSHFKQNFDCGKAKRIEFLPIHWHQALHGDATGVDSKIRRLTLPSISRLRQFTNETLLDILFYSSPVYCQTIVETVGNELNSLYELFLSRNPGFTGRVSLAGHSLGSLILFDLLCHQRLNGDEPAPGEKPEVKAEVQQPFKGSTNSLATTISNNHDQVGSIEEALEKLSLEKFAEKFKEEQVDLETLLMCSEADLKDLSLPMGPRKKLLAFVKDFNEKQELLKQAAQQQPQAVEIPPVEVETSNFDDEIAQLGSMDMIGATNVNINFQQFDTGTGQPAVQYPQLNFHPQTLFAFGSPIGMFLTVRGIEELGEEFKLPTCDGFLNVYHPFDPCAYRVEPLIDPDFEAKPILVPHYKGRKRMHLELRDSIGRMGQELKDGIIRSVRMAIGSVQRFAANHWNTEQKVEEEVKNMTEEILKQNGHSVDQEDNVSVASELPQLPSEGIGLLNNGKRIDFVLQERPLESFNDYLFAFQSHLCYWNNEDTVLLLMKDVYEQTGVLDDRQIQKNANLQTKPQPPPTSSQMVGGGENVAAPPRGFTPATTNISLN